MDNRDSCPCAILDKRSWWVNVPLTMLLLIRCSNGHTSTHFSNSDKGSELRRFVLVARATTPGVTKQSHNGCCSSMSRSLYAAEGHSAKTLGDTEAIPPAVVGGKNDADPWQQYSHQLDKSAAGPTVKVEWYGASHKS